MAAVLAACGGTAETGNYTALEITSSGSAETVEELDSWLEVDEVSSPPQAVIATMVITASMAIKIFFMLQFSIFFKNLQQHFCPAASIIIRSKCE